LSRRSVLLLKVLVWIGGLTPAVILLVRGLTDDLGANPIEKITHWTGLAALNILIVTLAITPLRRITHYNDLIKLRRPIGLFAFFYVVMHLLTYVVLDLFFDFSVVADDILERPYITVGFAAFLLLIPLALTSTRGWIRRLGKKWAMLHALIYVATALGVVHYLWKEKADTRDPSIFGFILIVLLLARLVIAVRKRNVRMAEP
jgi:sulfoxide reductase heme-binding subunit YedZ